MRQRRVGPRIVSGTPTDPTPECARCHGEDGRGGGHGAFPSLAGQRVEYLQASLRAYAEGRRHSGMMEAIAADLDESRARQLARHYSELPPGSSPDAGWDGAAARRGARIAERGVPETRVPSCVDCHGPDAGERNPAYPVLAGQHAAYLILQLELFQTEARGGSPWAGLMRPSVHRLTPQQTRDVAHYYASLGG